MRNIATCYSEHAVRVSDSYCSGPMNRSPKSIPALQTSVSQTFKANITDQTRVFMTVTWRNNLIRQGFLLNLSHTNLPENPANRHHHQMGKPKGNEPVEFEEPGSSNIKARVIWDLSSARFESGPEPLGSFFFVVKLIESQTALLLGDMEDDTHVKNLIWGIEIRRLSLVAQHENFKGEWSSPVQSRVRLGGSGREHEITIACSPDEEGPVLSVWVDKKKVVRVRRVRWNFRGNQVIFVDGFLVDVMWDVFGWLFYDQRGKINNDNNTNYKGCGLFMFRTRSGLDSRLWMEEEQRIFANHKQSNEDTKPHFSLLISSSTSSKTPTF